MSSETDWYPGLCIDNFITFSTGPNFFPVIQFLHLDTYRAQTFAAHQHHIGPWYRRFAFNNAALTILGGWSGMLFDDVNIFNKDPILFPVDSQHFTNLAFISAGNDLYLVIFFYVTLVS